LKRAPKADGAPISGAGKREGGGGKGLRFAYALSGVKWYISITMRTELVTTLKRRATEIISDIEANKVPILITQHGRPAAYLLDVESFDELRRKIEILEGIALGEEAVRAGKVLTQAQAKRKMSKWLK